MQTIKDFLYQTGKNLGIDTFLKSIGPWGTLILSIIIGIVALILVFTLLKQCAYIETTWLKLTLMLVLLGVSAFAFYVYVDGTISIIDKLGGLQA